MKHIWFYVYHSWLFWDGEPFFSRIYKSQRMALRAMQIHLSEDGKFPHA